MRYVTAPQSLLVCIHGLLTPFSIAGRTFACAIKFTVRQISLYGTAVALLCYRVSRLHLLAAELQSLVFVLLEVHIEIEHRWVKQRAQFFERLQL